VRYDEPAVDASAFALLGVDLQRETSCVTRRKVAAATARLVPQRALIAYGEACLRRHRADGAE
jgi:hypothetical protein